MKKYNVKYIIEFEKIEGDNKKEVLEETNELLRLMIEGEEDLFSVFKVKIQNCQGE